MFTATGQLRLRAAPWLLRAVAATLRASCTPRVVLVFTLLLVGATPARALAGGGRCPPRPRSVTEARQLAGRYWKQGVAAYRKRGFAAALHAWQCSQKLVPTAAGLLNIAKAAASAGRPWTALAAYRRFLVQRPRSPRRAEILQHMRAMQAAIDARVATRPWIYPERRTESRPRTRPQPEARPRPRARPRPDARPQPRLATRPRPRRPRSSFVPSPSLLRQKRVLRVSGGASLGVGLALGATAAILGGLAARARQTVVNAEAGTAWKAELADPFRQHERYVLSAWVTGALGAAAVTLGAVLLGFAKGGGERIKPERDRVALQPTIIPGGAALRLDLRF